VRAQPPTVQELFSDVRKNYFRIFANYTYFNFGLYTYFQIDNIFGTLNPRAHHCGGAITSAFSSRSLAPSDRSAARSSTWPTLDDDCRAHLHLQAPARLRVRALTAGPLSPIEKEVESPRSGRRADGRDRYRE
jgi:hypothetical protein